MRITISGGRTIIIEPYHGSVWFAITAGGTNSGTMTTGLTITMEDIASIHAATSHETLIKLSDETLRMR